MALPTHAPRHPTFLRRRAASGNPTTAFLAALRRYGRILIIVLGVAFCLEETIYYRLPRKQSPEVRADGAPTEDAERQQPVDASSAAVKQKRIGAPLRPPHEPKSAILAGVPASAKEWKAQRTKVSCGGHFAPSCAECAQGHGAGFCNGQCSWNAAKNKCIEPPSSIHPAYLDLVTNNYAFQPVRTDGGGYVNIIMVRAPFRSEEERDSFEKYKDEILFIGISSFEAFPLSSPNPFSSNFSDSLYTSMFPGFLHMMHEPERHFPPHVKTLLLSQSDFELPHDTPLAESDTEHHMYDFTFSVSDMNVEGGCVGWGAFAKNWSFMLEALEVMCSDEFDLRGVLVGTRDKQDKVRCAIPPQCEGKMTQTSMMTQDKYFDYMRRSRFTFLPQVYDASPRVATQSLCLDVPLLMNKHILGGWKYVNEETGEFFSDMTDLRDSIHRILDNVKKRQYHPRRWVKANYGNEHAGVVLLNWVKEHFADRIEIPEGTNYLIAKTQ
uniref:Uncharacterized protein n=1 Tax=Odontella aurita TaxID=265563 RepID=A0A7S4JMQ7_9STRA